MSPSRQKVSDVVIVDGSNIATEGRSTPSLRQLDEAVRAFRDEYPDTVVTVVVDATFGHRIDRKEVAEFDEAVANNEVVAPPAGAIGRGDAFVLSIANKVGARVLSNDSFQEFHGDYPWLFHEGRLIGGKPVPNIGWIFVERLPVKGPTSRKAQRAARRPSKESFQPMPVPTEPPPSGRRAAKAAAPAPPPTPAPIASDASTAPPPATSHAVNDVIPFLDFVEHHPVGSSVNGVVESYSSHGAYVTVGPVRGYVPLRLMADPPPRSAREVVHIGDAVTLVVTNFSPGRRSIELAMPDMGPPALVPAPELEVLAETVTAAMPAAEPVKRKAAGRKAPAKKAAAKKEAAAAAPAKKVTAEKPAKKAATKKAAPAKKAAAKKAAAKKAAAKKAAPRRTAATKTAARKRTANGSGD